MREMSVRELNSNLSAALSLAAAGEEVRVHKNGRPFVRIVPEPATETAEERHARGKAELAEWFASLPRIGDVVQSITEDDKRG